MHVHLGNFERIEDRHADERARSHNAEYIEGWDRGCRLMVAKKKKSISRKLEEGRGLAKHPLTCSRASMEGNMRLQGVQ